ncbi:MAG TPA: DegQ family serine endoprotease [Noviherbaspirillum sp.]|uniref:DegQ family serine endoprotease n=1 Tax=Noviherbaspirillum sp. TaxID=1926288 RepID=UPI002DDD5863|nr:DegQ family serine endoprotease [Noviherbaspirillum sp.]HEV2611356.1 DegQ family serine endoprotease [Noviherbaspirillum sp.]
MKLKSLTLALIATGAIATGTANAVGWSPATWFNQTSASAGGTSGASTASTTGSANNASGAAIPATAVPNYRAIVEQYGPAVVGIRTESTSRASSRSIPDGPENHPFFERFGGMPGFGGQMPRGDAPVRGQGSGFIVSKDGMILTNAHVVQDADEVTVKLSDRREYKAKVLGSDPVTDVAVLKINAENLPVVNLGDPAKLGVGDYVLAIGSPFGFEQSATAGIVSAKGRSLPGDGHVPFIQTDVAVNPGNSGGPLFDTSGAVIGINSQIYSRTGGYQGVSFAIPINVALQIKDQIVSTGKVTHPRLGVTIQELNQTLAESFRLKQPDGALVSSVAPGSAAAKAGLEPGDVILQYNGRPIASSTDLPAMVSLGKPGDKVTLGVWRGGKQIELSASLGAVNDRLASGDTAEKGVPQGRLGLAVRPLSAEEKSAGASASGVLVERSSGPAAKAGIEAGDIILAVNGTPVKSVDELKSVVAKQDKQLAILVQRGDARIFVPVTIG